MNNKVCNKMVEVNEDCFNDKDILEDLLLSEKNISNNISIALNEMSNEILYDNIFTFLQDTKDNARILFDLMFKNGWYTLEKADQEKIEMEINKLNKKIK